MNPKRFPKGLFFLGAAVLFWLVLAACGGLTGGEDDAPSIPQDVLDIAEGIFDTIDLVFECDTSDPAQGTYPAGMSVAWVTYDTVLKLAFTNYAPDTGVTINGSLTMTKTGSSPLSMTVGGSLAMTGLAYSSASLNCSVVWPLGTTDPGDEDPQSIKGTFIFDGKSYDVAAILEAIEDLNDGDGGSTPASVSPLPSTFMTSLGNLSQSFDDRVWRPAPAASGDRWAEYDYMRFSIGSGGDVYAVYLAGVETAAGFINWHSSGGLQKLDFLDSNKTSILYSFTVLSYSANCLHLATSWEGTTKEWLFTAGMGNLCGLVLDQTDVTSVPPYNYYKPVAGATVEFGTFTGDTFNASGLTTSTDADGFFVFAGLLPTYDGQKAGVRVSASGYTTYTMSSVESLMSNLFVAPTQLYKTVFLSP